MRIIFMGTPDFAVPCLKKLCDAGEQVVAVFTQPDKKVGRKQLLTPSQVKIEAERRGLAVFQPATLKSDEVVSEINALEADLIVVVAYGKILPKAVLDAPKYGAINVHASILPKYRGAAPIQWAVINGDSETGVTVMQMDEGLDTGDMILVKKVPIGDSITSAELFDELAPLGAEALIEAIEMIKAGTAERTPQPKGDFGYASMITKAMSPIDWGKSATEVHNLVRGLQTWPSAQTVINGKTVKIHKTKINNSPCKTSPSGTVLQNKGVLTVRCGEGAVDILELQPEGKKRMDVKAFLAGNNVNLGDVIGK